LGWGVGWGGGRDHKVVVWWFGGGGGCWWGGVGGGGGGGEGDWPFVDRDEVLAAMSASGRVALPALLRGPKTPVIFGL